MNYAIGGIISIGFFLIGCTTPETISEEVTQKQPQEIHPSCYIEPIKKVITGDSMAPMLQPGDTIDLYPDYYTKCKTLPKKGELVAIDFSGESIPIIKTIVATQSDHVMLKNKTLWVNNTEVKNSVGQSYQFSDGEYKMLSLYITNNSLPKGSIFILGDNIYNSKDSRKFGAVSIRNILGKFE